MEKRGTDEFVFEEFIDVILRDTDTTERRIIDHINDTC